MPLVLLLLEISPYPIPPSSKTVLPSYRAIGLTPTAFWRIAALSVAIDQKQEVLPSQVRVAYRSALEMSKCPTFPQ